MLLNAVPTKYRSAAIDALGGVLVIDTKAGATWDAGWVRGRLRTLGVRRRIVAFEPPTTGWGATTASELDVARLGAEGLINREAADRLFVSAYREQPSSPRIRKARDQLAGRAGTPRGPHPRSLCAARIGGRRLMPTIGIKSEGAVAPSLTLSFTCR